MRQPPAFSTRLPLSGLCIGLSDHDQMTCSLVLGSCTRPVYARVIMHENSMLINLVADLHA